MNPAARCRQEKEKYPDRYCPRCLWRTGGGHCPRHGGKPLAVAVPESAPTSTREAKRLVWRRLREHRLYLRLTARRVDYLDNRRERYVVTVHGAAPDSLAIEVPGVLVLFTERRAA